MKTVGLIAILFFVALAAATKSLAQMPPGPPPPNPTQVSLTNVPDTPGPAIGEQFTELAVGIFAYSKIDLSLPGPMSINVGRVYRSNDQTSSNWNNRAFGVGTRLNYDMFIYTTSNGVSVSMPDSSVLNCSPSGSEYVCNSQPSGVWFGSTISNNVLTRVDGTMYAFNSTTGLLMSITDRFNNSITITRGASPNGSMENAACASNGGGGSVPANYVGTVSSSNGRAVYFCYDDTVNYRTDITGIADNTAGGPIKKITYTYVSSGELATVTQPSSFNNGNATTTYQYNQTTPSGVGNITTIIVNDGCNNSACNSPKQVFTYIAYTTNSLQYAALGSISSQLPGNGYQYNNHSPSAFPYSHVTVSLPDNATRDLYFDPAGYVTKDVRNVNAGNPETTVFNRGSGLQYSCPQQEVGASEEFVCQVNEENSTPSVVRQTNYSYDSNGNVTSVQLSPAPGTNPGTATWNYTYTTFNRLLSFVEPLAYNGTGTTYSYIDSGCTHSMTVTDPLDRTTTVDYNCAGQPTSIADPLGNPPTQIQYYSNGNTNGDNNGDLESVTDPLGNKTSYMTDADGRVKTVTSPLQESTNYVYDALDDVTQITDPLGNVTCYTYDLIGLENSSTPPKGYAINNSCPTAFAPTIYTTTVVRNANLAKTTLTDPLGNTTVTDLDGQGRSSDYTDKRGVETTYTYNKFGEVTEALFNSNNKSAYNQEEVDMSNYDALDRVGQIADKLLGNTNNFTYDSLDSILTASDNYNQHPYSVSYTYDLNDRPTIMTPSWEGVSNYGYDCADELVSMSNNGSSLQSCSPSTSVGYSGNTSTQVAINYDKDGNTANTLVDGVQTFMTRDQDERVIAQTFQPSPEPSPSISYGGLSYIYDADGHVIDKGGSLAVVNMPSPAASPTASYSGTDQLTSWKGVPSATDKASNITTDPVSGLSMTWNARNQLNTFSAGAVEQYDGLGRRETSGLGANDLDFEYDGFAMIGWTDGSLSYNFLTAPGGGAVAGSYTASGTTTTWVPLIDASGSTIGLVNAANVNAGPVTTYTYDPSGTPSVTGSANDWPFQYNGMEKELTDPSTYYYTGLGQFYSPQLSRSLSEVGETSSSQGACPSGNDIGAPSGSSGSGLSIPSSFGTVSEKTSETARTAITVGGAAAAGATIGAIIGAAVGNPLAGFVIGAAVGAIVGGLANFFDDLFGGGSPPLMRQLRHQRHPLYPAIMGVSDGLIPDEVSAGAPEIVGDQHPANTPPMQSNGNTLEISPQATPTATPKVTLQQLWQIAKCTGISDEALLEIYQGLGVKYRDAAFLVQHRFSLHGSFESPNDNPGEYHGCDPNAYPMSR